MQAVARAVALGYLDLDAVSFVRAASSSDLRDFSTLHALLAQSESAEALPGGPSLRRLAQFGLLLMLAAAAAATVLRSDETADVPMIGIVCRLDSSGKVRAAFGGDRLRSARAVTIGPPACADHGFAPGAVYVVNEALAQSGLNTAEIVEYSFPGGDAPPTVRSFAGSREVGTRLSDVASLTFDTSGRLLAACGALTNGLLAFTEGGARVSRLASVRASQVAVAESGLIYAAASAPDGARIETMAPDGRHVRTLVSAPLDARYAGIAVGHDGRILVNRVERGRGAIEEFTPEGEPSRLFTAPGIRDARLCVDRQGHILAACPATCDVRVFQADGRPLRRIPLESIVTPSSVAVADDGAIWVSGQAE
jgi:sugar lactone lactonase YvrE